MKQYRAHCSVAVGAIFVPVVLGAGLSSDVTSDVDRDFVPSSYASFGNAVAVVEGDVLVGESDRSPGPGIVYVYRRSGNAWMEVARLTASDKAGDPFGNALDADGRTLLVGATSQQSPDQGDAYIYERSTGGEWRQVAHLTPQDSAGLFGFSVAIAGDVALVGAPFADGQKGAVYVFRRGPGGWAPAGKFSAADAQPRTFLGVWIAFDGTHALATSPSPTGGVYAFRLENGAWRELGKLTAEGVQPGSQFGIALQVDKGRAFVGAPNHAGTGTVLVYRADASTGAWSPAGVIKPQDATPQRFGAALALDGERLWIGAPAAVETRGAIHSYLQQGDEWRPEHRVQPTSLGENDQFGGSIASSGGVLATGLTGADHGEGKVAILQAAPPGGWNVAATVFSEKDELDAVTGRAVDCASGKAGEFDCNGTTLLSFLPISAIGGGRGVDLSGIWGWTDTQTGNEYALVGRTDGVAFVDITDPVNPVYLGQLLRTRGSPASSWREIKVYKDHAFVSSDAARQHGIQIFDLTRLRQYAGKPIDFQVDARYDRVNSAHNIVINEESGFAYAVGNSSGGETCGGGLHIIDIRDPKKPQFAGCYADTQTGMARTGYTHDAQCVMYKGPDSDYQGREICVGSNETAISIADVTDKKNVKFIARASYPNVGYTHQGWFTGDQRYFYVNDEGDEVSGTVKATRTLVWDLADLDDPVLAKEFMGTTAASDHNLYIKDNLMYQSNYVAGLRIIDITDPVNPVEVGYLDTVPGGENAPGFAGSWSNYPFFKSGTIVVSSIEQGLFVVRKAPARRPVSQ